MSHGRSLAVASLLALALVATAAGSPALADAAAPAASSDPIEQPTLHAVNDSDADREANGSDADREANGSDRPRIVGLYPNPIADGDAGEYVVIEVPAATNLTGWTLGDGDRDLAYLPNETVQGTVAASVDPAVAENATGDAVTALSGRLRLANGGERVALRHNGTLVDAAAYDSAPEGELWQPSRDADGRHTDDRSAADADATAAANGTWTPLGATDFEPATSSPDAVTAFALPDAPGLPVERIERAEERVLLAGYTFADRRVADALIDAHERGVRVEIAVDDAPVGGITDRQVRVLDRLDEAGVDVFAIGGEHARYRYHHPKYAVIDDEALVTTENWKPAGTGGHSSRGWGVVVHGSETAAALREVFEADVGWRDAVPWSEHRNEIEPETAPPANGTFPRRIAPERMDAESVRLVTAPDNAESELVTLLESANESILIQQVSIGGRDNPLLDATIDAARRGVSVKILLSSAWYAEEENRKLADWLERRAADEDLDLRVRLAEPRGRYEKIHAKGVVVDEEAAVIGSINWNTNSLRENREVAVIVEGQEAGEYYARLFRADWRGGIERLPVGLGVALVVGALGAVAAARRRVAFE
ncbi:phospholipase D-like domain-containing protein [Natronoarchaeum rubrum]|uniref:phospholipase D-like domain-containing protein n=1 Tax=Natronoarchaeum rubrum TaxID=755311 RepID=UPI002111D836|nr:phospholipase D-like domain-containing protein [Natronoarchaeum rubrum]